MTGSVIALGTFDGVHRGHQRIIKKMVARARRLGLASIVLTFDPHPQQVVAPERGLKLLTSLKERKELFAGLGVKRVKVIKFTPALQRLSDDRFVKKYLIDRWGVREVFVGYDFAFGRGRSGGVGGLRKFGQKYGFRIRVEKPVRARGAIVKSSLIRELISSGKLDQAVELLGHPYQVEGRVVRGSGVGIKLGFPTANLEVDPHKLIPSRGVYAGHFGQYKCAVNIGGRPTFGGGETIFEVHVIGFHGNIRGRKIMVSLLNRLRDERQFTDVAELKQQIRKDVEQIRGQ